MIGKIKSFIIFLSCLLAGVCLFNACSQFTQSVTGSVSVCLPMVSEMPEARLAAGDVNSYTIKLVDSSGAEVKSETVVEGGNHTFSELSPGDYTVSVEAHKVLEDSISLIGAGESRVVVVAGETAQANVILRYYGAAQIKVTYNGEPFKGKADISYRKFAHGEGEEGEIEEEEIKDVEFSEGVYTIERLPAMPRGTEYGFTVKIKNISNADTDLPDNNEADGEENASETEKTEFGIAPVVSGEVAIVEVEFRDEEPVFEADYKVEHWYEFVEANENGDTYELKDEEILHGVVGDMTTATPKDVEGFTAKAFDQLTIAEGAVVKIYYDRNAITLVFNLDGGTDTESVSGKYGASVTVPENPTKTGYTFEGWLDASGAVVELPKTFPATDVTYTAKWIEIVEPKPVEVNYKVEHYQQNIENDEYEIVSADTETLTGTTDADTEAKAKTYEGFTAKEVKQEKILADGSTVVKIYYDRKEITLAFNLDGGTGMESVSGKYGAVVTVPENPTKTGYTFEGWLDASGAVAELPKTFPAADAAYKANWLEIVEPKPVEVNYKVEHYQQNTENDEYEIVSADTEALTGTTDTDTVAVAKTYTGFTAKEVKQEKIAADGSTVVKIYYDRKEITLTLNLDGGTGKESVSGKYGAVVTVPENPTKTGYTFEGWLDASGAIVELPKTFPAMDVTYTANWIKIVEPEPTTGTISGIEITYYKDNDIKLSASGDKDTEIRTFTTESGYRTYKWYLNDSLIYGADTNEYALDCSKLEAGVHSIMVLAIDIAGNIYSASSTVAVYKR